ncbi:hypothetical protein Hanom_Chr09g00802731 [Helianthus anomalus]
MICYVSCCRDLKSFSSHKNWQIRNATNEKNTKDTRSEVSHKALGPPKTTRT